MKINQVKIIVASINKIEAEINAFIKDVELTQANMRVTSVDIKPIASLLVDGDVIATIFYPVFTDDRPVYSDE